MDRVYKIFRFGDMSAVYGISNGQAAFTLIPGDMEAEIVGRKLCGADSFGRERTEPSMQIGVEGDGDERNFSAGRTYKNREQAFRFGIPEWTYDETETGIRLVAEYRSEKLYARQLFFQKKGTKVLETHCEVKNICEKEIVLESVPSFTISRLSPFVEDNAETEMYIYRMRNNWSAEGELLKQTPGELGFEDSWGGLGVRVERFGQVGSMPANGWLPWLAAEDAKYDCTWGIELEAPASWQMELCYIYGGLSLSGGQADFLFGHWKKILKPGETFRTYKAYLTVCRGGLYQACHRLVSYKKKKILSVSAEKELSVVYNEYCHSWGRPSAENVERLLPACRELGIGYFVTDAGWYCPEGKSWESIGDWRVNEKAFPGGMKAFADKCLENGLLPGIWFEFESVSTDSDAAHEHPEWLLTCNGKPICHGGRCMWDMRKKEVTDYLTERVIDLLRESGLRYLKVDYNESTGVGADGAESLGEGLRRHTEAVLEFYERIRRELPEIVIEICASGGMRHEPLWQSCGNLCSFSDAHEEPEGALIAADLHRIIPPEQLLIWAVIRREQTVGDVYFTLVKAMLGRPCLSGDIASVSEEVWQILKDGMIFYGEIKGIIRDGETLSLERRNIRSLRHIRGIQILKRISAGRKHMLVYCFRIGTSEPEIRTEAGRYLLKNSFGNAVVRMEGKDILFSAEEVPLMGCVALLEKEE